MRSRQRRSQSNRRFRKGRAKQQRFESAELKQRREREAEHGGLPRAARVTPRRGVVDQAAVINTTTYLELRGALPRPEVEEM